MTPQMARAIEELELQLQGKCHKLMDVISMEDKDYALFHMIRRQLNAHWLTFMTVALDNLCERHGIERGTP